ncbi:helix-turn-helix domain-containing protein [Polymorphobacter fuscus]|uniref:Helix-turn-helix domain-containing protein n=1 Tax=Sandarakinorhabdus fusca TaxID=1439888 RepID=A0A7C9GQV3_9SPHN|nr:helix-turn-helix domain-containing protein [Polymorphobacter fuscus]KAB7645552.1 helix-turn-helix domain-containing protein [Polymorphobacter fuscus]MQT17996.1 helix-turn-helix domain-containing protein [Polymorphobacter fuscus]NJC08624.1 putative DNA-binding transcriptional regulator AlpA [Polymorphobacter fuscus]
MSDNAFPKLPVELPSGARPALNTEQAAAYCGLAATTMETLRCRGGGPRFVRYGRKAIRYVMSDLDQWMAARTVGSTSENLAA